MTLLRTVALLAAFSLAWIVQAQNAKAQQVLPPKPRQQDKIFPIGASWIAVSLNGKPFAGDRPSFTLNQQFRATGFSGCNTYSATAYPLRGQTLAVSAFALTDKKCSDGLMQLERAFLTALRTSQKWDQQGSTLIINTANGGVLRFERAL